LTSEEKLLEEVLEELNPKPKPTVEDFRAAAREKFGEWLSKELDRRMLERFSDEKDIQSMQKCFYSTEARPYNWNKRD